MSQGFFYVIQAYLENISVVIYYLINHPLVIGYLGYFQFFMAINVTVMNIFDCHSDFRLRIVSQTKNFWVKTLTSYTSSVYLFYFSLVLLVLVEIIPYSYMRKSDELLCEIVFCKVVNMKQFLQITE